jgi:transposase, IS5 family
MIIRQECLFTFEEIMKSQKRKENRLELILGRIDTEVVSRLFGKRRRKGPEGYPMTSLLLGLIAMRVMGIRYVSELVRQLELNPVLRWLCGFNVMGRTPSEATYSRFIAWVSEYEIARQLFEEMVRAALDGVPCEKVAIDASAIEARENSFARQARRVKDSPADPEKPSWGVKSGTAIGRGRSHWYGWKLHLAVDADTGFPLAFDVTTASVHDSKRAEALCASVHNLTRAKPHFYLLDKSYDTEQLHRFIRGLGASPIIPIQSRRNPTPAPELDEHCAPVCSMGFTMTYWGFDGKYHKFRCPHVCGKVVCPMGASWCSPSNYGFVVKQSLKADPRKFGFPHRCTRDWHDLYKNRNHIERCFALLKSFCSLGLVPHRGRSKASAWFALSLVVLLAGLFAA